MSSRLDDIPVFERRNTMLPARLYNLAHIALKRLGSNIRLPLPKLLTLDLVIDKEAWIIIDHSLNDIPVAAWTTFKREHNDVIQEPVNCELRLYHKDADIILDRVLEAMELLLGEQMSALQSDEESGIIPFNKNKSTHIY
jgi:hypothetical protein